jgi:hypothetical protein
MDRFEYAAESAETEFQKHLKTKILKMYRGPGQYMKTPKNPTRGMINKLPPQAMMMSTANAPKTVAAAVKLARKVVKIGRNGLPMSEYNSKGPAPISAGQAAAMARARKSLR